MERAGREGAAAGLAALLVVAVGRAIDGRPALGLERAATREAFGLPDGVAAALWAPMQLGTASVALAVALVLGVVAGWRAAARTAAAVLCAWVAADLLKVAFDRPRLTAAALGGAPRELVTSSAYPSAHAAVAFALAASVASIDRRWQWWALLLAILVAAGRAVAGVHTALDLVGGAAVGCAMALGLHALELTATGRPRPTDVTGGT